VADSIDVNDVFAMLRGRRSPEPAARGPYKPYAEREHPRYVWGKCSGCGEHLQGLISGRLPVNDKSGNWCDQCWERGQGDDPVTHEQLSLEV
jgi:hypothetical protein